MDEIFNAINIIINEAEKVTNNDPERGHSEEYNAAVKLLRYMMHDVNLTHEKNNIISDFTGKYGFLSNSFPCCVRYDGMTFPSATAAFQAAKTSDREMRERFVTLSPREAVKLGHEIDITWDWDSAKVNIMRNILMSKFATNLDLADWLINTNGYEIQAGIGSYTDSFWGIGRDGNGDNVLGKLLMEVRNVLVNKKRREERRPYIITINDADSPTLTWAYLTDEEVDWHLRHNFIVRIVDE